MNAHAARQGRWPFLGPALATAVALGLAAGLLGGVLSRTLVLDMIALWPIPAVALPAAVAAWFLRRRRPRLIAVPGLIVFTWLVLSLALHLAGPDWLPSAAADVARPSPLVDPQARLVVDLDAGSLSVEGRTDPGYGVAPVRAGGTVGAPEVLEQAGGGLASLVVVPRDDSWWFRFRGWSVSLGPGPRWDLDVRAGRLDIDLSTVVAGAVRLTGVDGTVRLGSPDPEGSSLVVDGSFDVVLPAGVPAVVQGDAALPTGWRREGAGGRAPVEGTGWTIEVAGGDVRIEET